MRPRLSSALVVCIATACNSTLDEFALLDGGRADSAQPPTSSVCDLANGGADCGACPTECDDGWICVGNTCALVLASGLDAPRSIAVDETHLYVTTADAVERLDHDGSGALTLAGSLPQPYSIELDATDLFWIDETRTISAMPKSGGTPRSIGSGDRSSPTWTDFALDASSVYWSDGSNVMKAPKTGGSASVVVTSTGPVTGVAADDMSVYWSSDNGIPDCRTFPDCTLLSKRDHATAASRVLGKIGHSASGLTVHDSALYWTELGPGGPFSLKTVDAIAGGDPTTLHEVEVCPDCKAGRLGYGNSGAVTDGVHVYWVVNPAATEGGGATDPWGRLILYRTSLVTGTTERFADFYVGDQMGSGNFALWGGHLYLAINTGPGPGWILKLEK